MSFKNIKQNLISSLEVEDGRIFDKSNGFIEFRILEEAGVATTSMATISFSIKGFVDLKGLHVVASYGYKFEDGEEYLSFGPFVVDEQTYDKKLDRSTFTGFDLMLEMCKVAKLQGIEYPITATGYLTELANRAGVNSQIERIDYTITEDVYSNTGHEYRSITEDIAELSNQIMFFKGGVLVNKTSKETGIKLIKKNITEFSLLPKFGPVDSLVLSRYPQEDNVYPESIDPENVKYEIKFADNLLVERKRQEVIDALFSKYRGLTWQPFTLKTVGIGFIELGDIISVEIDDENYQLEVLGKELTVAGGIFETLFCNEIKKSTTRYQYATDSRRKQLTTDLIVDKQNGEIKTLIKQVGDRTDKETSLTQDVDSIVATVSEMNTEASIIPNANGALDYFGWTFGTANKGVKWGDLYRWYDYQSWGANFVPVEVHSLSKTGLKFVSRGTALTSAGYVVPDTTYSFKAKRHLGTQRFKLNILEYDKEMKKIKSTTFDFKNSSMYEVATIQPAQNTMYARLEYDIIDDNDLILTEIMFNRGDPSSYKDTPEDVRLWAQAQFQITNNKIESTVKEVSQLNDKVVINSTAITQLSTGISLVASKVDGVYGDIHNAGLEINAVEGVTVYGKKFSIWNESKTKEIFKINTIDGQEQVYMYGSIQSEGGEIAFDSENKEIKIGDTKLRSTSSAGMLLIKGNAINLDSDTSGVAYGLSFKGVPAIVKFSNGGTTGYLDNIIPRTNALNISSQSTIRISTSGGSIDFKSTSVDVNVPKRLYLDNPSFEIDMNQDSERLSFLNKSQGGTRKGVFLEKWGNLLAYNGANLGWVDYRYGNLYLSNQPNVSSDERLKYNISEIDDLLLDSFEPLREKYFKTTHDDMHSFGYIAQDVEECLYDFARKVWSEDEVEKQMSLFKILSRDGEYMSLLYGEVKVIMLAVLRRNNDRLEQRIKRLEELHGNSK